MEKWYKINVNINRAQDFIQFLTELDLVDSIIKIIKHDDIDVLEYSLDLENKNKEKELLEIEKESFV